MVPAIGSESSCPQNWPRGLLAYRATSGTVMSNAELDPMTEFHWASTLNANAVVEDVVRCVSSVLAETPPLYTIQSRSSLRTQTSAHLLVVAQMTMPRHAMGTMNDLTVNTGDAHVSKVNVARWRLSLTRIDLGSVDKRKGDRHAEREEEAEHLLRRDALRGRNVVWDAREAAEDAAQDDADKLAGKVELSAGSASQLGVGWQGEIDTHTPPQMMPRMDRSTMKKYEPKVPKGERARAGKPM